jgi:hypothetical protein
MDKENAKESKIIVDAQTFLALQIAQLDNNIADAEVHEAEASLEVAKAKKMKTQTILDFNIDQVEKQQALQKQQQPQTEEKSEPRKSKLKKLNIR